MPEVELAPEKFVGDTHPCFFIAEVGQNHQGSLEIAKKLIDAAHEAGANCVKFQKTSLSDKFTKSALERPYDSEHSWGNTYGEHKLYLEFSLDDFIELKSYAEKRNLLFTASAKDIPSLDFLVDLDVPFIKIGSGDSDDFLLLEKASKCGKPLIISTGMQNMNTVRQVYNTVKSHHDGFVLLHCVSSYPTDPVDVNLRVIQQYKKEFQDIVVGYSGHELGTIISVAAVTLGAKVIERHITLDKNQKGSDHLCSLLPQEFKQMVTDIRTIESALGSRNKEFLPCERKCFEKLGKSIVAAKDLLPGDIISKNDVCMKVSVPNGIPAKDLNSVLESEITETVHYDQPILKNHLKI
ncbi:sialic acid synthase [Planococcus citri]|uniref:sialic acid synthase n=1 Tax=Planococcus citri TaxID=170843 RepID=UPI0031FA2C2D